MREKMTDLNKQLEDKKKELEEQIFERDWGDNFGTKEFNENKVNILQAEIAILEQAIAEIKSKEDEFKELLNKEIGRNYQEGFEDCEKIAKAEMQKQRQESLDKIDLYLMVTKGNYECQKALEELKQQLNQPKEGES
jgi:ribonuclease HII